MAAFTPAGSGGLPPQTVTVQGVGTPTVANVSIPLANTEVSYPLPAGTKGFLWRLRSGSVDAKLAFSSGTSGTVYLTMNRGTSYSIDGLNDTAAITLYFQATAASQIAEIISWA